VTIKAIRIHENGGPDVLRWEDVELGPPGPGEVQIRHTAISVNFSDVNVRRGGFYIAKPLRFPVILGNEAAGIVEQIGPGETRLKPGQRVAYVGTGGPFYENTGAYAEARNLPASCLIALPAEISDRQAAALMMKGLTASMIIHRVFQPKTGDTILVHGAASGVGLLLCQWSKYLGATVLGTVGSHAKAEVCRAHGCDHPILYREVDFVGVVRKLIPRGVSAVFDGVGKDTFEKSLDCVRPFGMIVNYGNASGHPAPLDLILLAKKGSLSVSRPGVSHYQSDPEVMSNACSELFDLVRRGILRLELHKTYALRDAAHAHRDLEERRSIGAVVLQP
jgi:NADPH2:quinone reductase